MKVCKQNYLTGDGICMSDGEPCILNDCNQWKPWTNFDRIKAMSVVELAEFIHNITSSIAVKLNGEYISNETEYIKQYLESEVQGE